MESTSRKHVCWYCARTLFLKLLRLSLRNHVQFAPCCTCFQVNCDFALFCCAVFVCAVVAGQGHHGDQPGKKRCRRRPQAHAVQRDATSSTGSQKSRQDHGLVAQLSYQRLTWTGHDSGTGHAIWNVSPVAIRCFLRPSRVLPRVFL